MKWMHTVYSSRDDVLLVLMANMPQRDLRNARAVDMVFTWMVRNVLHVIKGTTAIHQQWVTAQNVQIQKQHEKGLLPAQSVKLARELWIILVKCVHQDPTRLRKGQLNASHVQKDISVHQGRPYVINVVLLGESNHWNIDTCKCLTQHSRTQILSRSQEASGVEWRREYVEHWSLALIAGIIYTINNVDIVVLYGGLKSSLAVAVPSCPSTGSSLEHTAAAPSPY